MVDNPQPVGSQAPFIVGPGEIATTLSRAQMWKRVAGASQRELRGDRRGARLNACRYTCRCTTHMSVDVSLHICMLHISTYVYVQEPFIGMSQEEIAAALSRVLGPPRRMSVALGIGIADGMSVALGIGIADGRSTARIDTCW